MAVNRTIKTLSKLSLGLVLILVWGWMWIRAEILFPVNTDEWRLDYVLTYLVFVTLVFSFDTVSKARTEKALFRVSFLKAFPKLIISAIVSFVILYLFGQVVNGGALAGIVTGLTKVGIGVIVLQAFMVAIFEELIFRGWVQEQLKSGGASKTFVVLTSSLIFALFHAWMGKSFLTMLIYIPLGFLFTYIKLKFSPETNMANSGVHFAWNLFILGFIQ